MPRLFLFPGLGADERMFAGLGKLCLPVVPVRLPAPRPHENMTVYAIRVAAQIGLRPEDWIGGSSFGSLVAADIARRRPVAGLVLIAGALNSDTLATPVQWLALLRHLLPIRALHPLFATRAVLSLGFGTLPAPQTQLLSDMLADTSSPMLREGARLITGYHPEIPVLCPVHAIHGDHDRFMQPPLPECRIVPGAGHALAVTHPREVTGYLKELLCA
jgi:pimeloyl-ACP methyl ester carboxylesterase